MLRPPFLFARLKGPPGLRKWLRYADTFLLFPFRLARARRWADLVHVTDQALAMFSRPSPPHLVTCHDATAMRQARGEFPEAPVGSSGRVLQRWISRGLGGASLVACVSEATRQDLLRLDVKEPGQLRVMPNPLPSSFFLPPAGEVEAFLQGLGLDAPYLLHVGSDAWYKNRPAVMAIHRHLVGRPGFEAWQLVLVGPPPRDLVPSPAIRVLQGLDDDKLRLLYAGAEALVFPSLAEGFGWPILEAQACGCPVITSSLEPMASLSGGAAILVDPGEPAAAAAMIAAAFPWRQALQEAGVANARRYGLAEAIQGYLGLYRELLAR